MILNETYDSIVFRLNNTYAINETENNKLFSYQFKLIKIKCKKSIRESKKLAKDGKYKEAIQTLEKCKSELAKDFNSLSKNIDFNSLDAIMSMIKYLAIPVTLMVAGLCINYAKNKYDNSKVIYQGKMLSKVDDLDKKTLQNLSYDDTFDLVNNIVRNDMAKNINLMDKIIAGFAISGIGSEFTVSFKYFKNIIKNKNADDKDKMWHFEYNMAKNIYKNLINCIDNLEECYKKNMKRK